MAIPLRADFDAAALRRWAKGSKDGAQARRLLALAALYDGASRAEAACLGSVTVQIVRDWVVRSNAHGPAGLIDRKPPGRPSRLSAPHDQRTASTTILGAICPAQGKAAGLVLPWCNIAAMELFLADLSARVAPG